jgi:hypothetical protein
MPVVCHDHEDLVESTEGYQPRATVHGRERFVGIDLTTCPPTAGWTGRPPPLPTIGTSLWFGRGAIARF